VTISLTCVEKTCAKPTSLPHGMIHNGACPTTMHHHLASTATTCTMACDSGYDTEAISLTCGDGGAVAYSGQCDETDCPAPSLDGSMQWQTSCGPMAANSQCTAECQDGYQGSTATTNECALGVAPSFPGGAPSCAAISCALPSLPGGASWQGGCDAASPIGHTETCTAACDAGYEAASAATNACENANGGAPDALAISLTCTAIESRRSYGDRLVPRLCFADGAWRVLYRRMRERVRFRFLRH
jgi:hypothetical protein